VTCLFLCFGENVTAFDCVLDRATEGADDGSVRFADSVGEIAQRGRLTCLGREYISVHVQDLSAAPAKSRVVGGADWTRTSKVSASRASTLRTSARPLK
jgi:hypothetical protein